MLPQIEVLGAAFDATDGCNTVVHDPEWPYLVGAPRRLIRRFALPYQLTEVQRSFVDQTVYGDGAPPVRNSVDQHVRDPAVPGSRGVVNGLSVETFHEVHKIGRETLGLLPMRGVSGAGIHSELRILDRGGKRFLIAS